MARNADPRAEESHRRGLACLRGGREAEAMEHLLRACAADPDNPRFRSAYAVGMARCRAPMSEALAVAHDALRRSHRDPGMYLNVARVYRAYGLRAQAVRALRRGLMLDARHPRLRRELADLGLRRPPVLRFLPRRHPLNRALGRLRARVWTLAPAG